MGFNQGNVSVSVRNLPQQQKEGVIDVTDDVLECNDGVECTEAQTHRPENPACAGPSMGLAVLAPAGLSS